MVGQLLDKYGGQFEMGYDAAKGEYTNMIEAGKSSAHGSWQGRSLS